MQHDPARRPDGARDVEAPRSVSVDARYPHPPRPLVSGTPVVVGLLVLAVAIVTLLVTLGRDPGIPAELAAHYTAVMAGSLAADIETSDPRRLGEALVRVGVPFTPRVAGLEPALVLMGGRPHAVAGRPAAAWLYRTPGMDSVLVQAFGGRLDELGEPEEQRVQAAIELRIFRKTTQTLACWQEGSLVYVFSSTLPSETVIGLARRHAAGARGPEDE